MKDNDFSNSFNTNLSQSLNNIGTVQNNNNMNFIHNNNNNNSQSQQHLNQHSQQSSMNSNDLYVKEEIVLSLNGDLIHDSIKKEAFDGPFSVNSNPNSMVTFFVGVVFLFN